MRKVCVVLTARTSYTKIRQILLALLEIDNVQVQLVCAASVLLDRYGNMSRNIKNDGFEISEKVYMLLEGEKLLTSAKSVGLGIIEFSGVFDRLNPDVVLVMADRFEVIAPAIAASYQNIPLAHIQGGEVTGNIDEKVRHAITKLADIHFPSTKRAYDWLLKMGENQSNVFLTGCPSIDLAKEVINNSYLDFNLYEKYGGVGGFPILTNGYYIVMQHPVTTEYEGARSQVIETLEAIISINKPVIWFWPNPDAGGDETSKVLREYREKMDLPNIHFIKNMEPKDFLKLLYNSNGIIGNSSVAIREASFLGIPSINIGSRQQNRERAINVIDVKYNRNEIKNAILTHTMNKFKSSSLYGDGNAAAKIAKIISEVPLTSKKIISYID
jgi:UDP-hydrolysing UDP-N-acetyl-D-glucosamine 2-epimerase